MPVVTLDVSETIYELVQDVAQRTDKTIESVIKDWLTFFVEDVPIENLKDAEVLTLAYMMLPQSQQDELSALLSLNSEGMINPEQKLRLDALMEIYHKGMVRKAYALAESVRRGLREPLR